MVDSDTPHGGAGTADEKRDRTARRARRKARDRGPRWRRILATFLIVLGCLLAPLSIAGIWVRNTLLDTNHYVDTVSPLAANAAVQDVLAHSITNALFANVDVESQLQAALPPKGQFLATPLEGTLQTFTFTTTRRALQSDRFQRLWDNANRAIHHQVVNLLTGKGKLVKNGQVAIPTAAVLARAKTALNARGVHIFDDVTLPPDKEQLVLFDSPDLVKVQGGVNVFQKIAWGLPIVAVLCLGGAVFLSKDRRRALVVVALAVAFSVGLLLVLYGLGRGLYLDAVSSPKLPRDAAAGVWDTVTTALKTAGRTVFALALVVAVGAWAMGPAKLATRLRATVRRGITGAGNAAGEPGAVAEYVGRHRGGFVGGGIVVALLVLVVWSAPTPLTILVITVVLLVYLGVVAFLARDAESAETVSSSSM